MLGAGGPGASKKHKSSQAVSSTAAAEANAAEALAALSARPQHSTFVPRYTAIEDSSHSDTQTEAECPPKRAVDPHQQQARKRRKRARQPLRPAAAAADTSAAGGSDPPVAAEIYKHASGVAKKVVEAPDGSCSVQLAHRLSSKSAATNNFWLHMPSNLARRCFRDPDLPCAVDILLTVDGEAPDAERSGRIKSTVRRRPGRSEYYIAGCSSALSAYKNYTVARMSVNSSATELTLHLQSPSVMEAAAAADQEEVAAAVAAARADAVSSGITGWLECKGTKKVITTTTKRSLLRVPAALVSKVYPAPLPAKFKVDLNCYKDNVLVGTRLGAALTPDRKNYEKSSYSVLLSEELQQQLAGCSVICHRGALPNHLQICFSSGQKGANCPAPAPDAVTSSSPAPGSPEEDHVGTAAGSAAATAEATAAAVIRPAAAEGNHPASGFHPSMQHRKQLPVVNRAAHKRPRAQEDGSASCRWFPWAGPSASPAGGSSAAVPACRLGGIRGAGRADAGGCGRQQQMQLLQHS